MSIKISPSLMCCKVEEMKPYLSLFQEVGIEWLHFDVMDGHYVKNIVLGTTLYNDVKRLSSIPVDLHLMTYHPEEFISYFKVRKCERISFHPETTEQPYKLLQTIRSMGCEAGLVLNPGTPLTFLEECLDQVDYVTLMTVNPGFAGQTMVPSALKKIERIYKILKTSSREIDLQVDGNTTLDNALKMTEAGANQVVVGTSSLLKDMERFKKNYIDYKQALEKGSLK